jgi:ABC-type polysaccharide/polyol phosphate transport system ATPase subunit
MTHVKVRDVSLQIPIYDTHNLRLFKVPSFGRAKVGSSDIRNASGTLLVNALQDVNLELSQGDRVCLIGHNGAGKTTLLRLLAGIYPPSTGVIEISGRVFALLGNSMSLNSDATGYENIRLIASLYNWPKDQLSAYIRDIEEFTELGEYLSLPTRVYSAGMQARLAFAMATTQSADILLIDENVGAGDAQFQEKSRERIAHFMNRAKIILLASHSQELCRAICNKAVWLSKGRNVFYGEIDEAFRMYLQN